MLEILFQSRLTLQRKSSCFLYALNEYAVESHNKKIIFIMPYADV